MEGYEIDEVLKSFEILIDTREQPSARAEKRYLTFGCPYRRATLNYGDYTFNFRTLKGDSKYNTDSAICPDVIVERKMSLDELASCFTHSRDRFSKEFQRAIDHGAKIYLLTENASWEGLMAGHYQSRFNSKAYFASLTAWMARYDISVIFCKEEVSGKLIKEILYRELKERLEKGVYDEETSD